MNEKNIMSEEKIKDDDIYHELLSIVRTFEKLKEKVQEVIYGSTIKISS